VIISSSTCAKDSVLFVYKISQYELDVKYVFKLRRKRSIMVIECKCFIIIIGM
jgi:hypothetical protein